MADRRERVRVTARELLVQVGARLPAHIDPIETAKELGIEIVFGHLTGATARIYRVGDKARIRVSDRISHRGRIRFSIAHEIAHYVLGHKIPTERDLASLLDGGCACHTEEEEREADVFAAEHLSPKAMALPYCDAAPVDLHVVRAFAEVFGLSPVASAVRVAELSPQPCAAVYSHGGAVKWMTRSASFPARVHAGKKVDPPSIAADYFAHGAIEATPRVLPSSCWLGVKGAPPPVGELVEHAEVVPEPGWGGVLSTLWVPRS